MLRHDSRQLTCLLLCSSWFALCHSIADGSDPHLAINPVYRTLIEEGVTANGEAYKLPLPALANATTAATQKAVIESVVDERLRERFFRDSVVAQHVTKLETKDRADGSRFRIAHFWFAAKADLDHIAADSFLDTITQEPRDEDAGAGRVLTASELKARDIQLDNPDPNKPNESYGHGEMRLFKKVQIATTNRSYWTQDDHSAVAAMMLDPRFVDDEEFPNRWRKLTRDEAGALISGEPQPYDGLGGYIKVIQLAEPKGFVLVEGHLVFVEPHDWFRGANLLQSKLPALIQTEIRRVRRALLSAAAR
jgi:hypothetical protein